MLLDLKGKCYLLNTPLPNNELLHKGCQPPSDKTSCKTLFLSKTPKLTKTLKPCRTKSPRNKNFQCHYSWVVDDLHVFLFFPLVLVVSNLLVIHGGSSTMILKLGMGCMGLCSVFHGRCNLREKEGVLMKACKSRRRRVVRIGIAGLGLDT
jgi:hypothetical protein